jgi:hypothetical protein
MSQPELRAALETHDDVDSDAPELTDEERWLLRHLAVAGALLRSHPDLYRELMEQREAEGQSDDVRSAAHEAAEQAATVLGSVRRRQDVLLAARETPVDPTVPLALLDQLFFCFTLLSGPDDELLESAIESLAIPPDFDALVEHLGIQEWLDRVGVGPA